MGDWGSVMHHSIECFKQSKSQNIVEILFRWTCCLRLFNFVFCDYSFCFSNVCSRQISLEIRENLTKSYIQSIYNIYSPYIVHYIYSPYISHEIYSPYIAREILKYIAPSTHVAPYSPYITPCSPIWPILAPYSPSPWYSPCMTPPYSPFMTPYSPYGPTIDPLWTPYGPPMDPYGPPMDPL